MSAWIAAFRGGVSCRRDQEGPLGLTLTGQSRERPHERVAVAFSGAAPDDLPEAVEDVVVERMGAGIYRISVPERDWVLPAAAVHVHREVATQFYRVVVPRVPPWGKRLFWQVVLSLLRHATGKRVLLALRRR